MGHVLRGGLRGWYTARQAAIKAGLLTLPASP
jgi:hypothetical protein